MEAYVHRMYGSLLFRAFRFISVAHRVLTQTFSFALWDPNWSSLFSLLFMAQQLFNAS